ncbi:MAG: hypothetical protein PVJ86_11055 [Phycisphaerales bacterium]|jgi:hypothetical protein
MAATINLKVTSNFDQAAADLKKFGNVSEAEAKRIKKFQDSFTGEQIDQFIDKTRRTGAAVKATSGDLKSLTVQQSRLNRETERLINQGLDPQDDAIKKLRREYDRLQKEIEQTEMAQKGLAAGGKAAVAGLTAIAGAVLAVGAAAAKSTSDLAQMGDTIAKTSATVGLSVEAFQELSFAAERSGLSSDSLGDIFKKLNRNIGDLQAGTGTLTTFLNKSNPALAEQLKNAQSSEEAFNLLVDEIAKAPTEFEKAALAQAAFGRSGQDLIVFANQGAEEINNLRQEAADYGVISTDVAKLSEGFVDSQRNLEQATIGVRAELAEKLLPVFTDVINGFADFISDGDRLKKTLEVIGLALAGVAAGFTAFLVITKGAAAIQGVAQAFRILNAAIAANPIGAIAVFITAILIPAIILLIKNWDKVVVVLETTIEKLRLRFGLFANAITTAWTVAINSLKILFFELADVIVDKALGGVIDFLEVAQKLPFVGEKLSEVTAFVTELGDKYGDLSEEAKKNSEAAIEGSRTQREELKRTTAANLEAINNEKDARLAALKEQEAEAKAANEETKIAVAEHEKEITDLQVTALKDRLAILNNVEAQARLENEATFAQFLQARMEQEGIAAEDRIEFLQSELARINELENISNEERLAAAATVEQQITDELARQANDRDALRRAELSATADLFGGLNDLVTAFWAKNREAAIASKALASAQAAINSYLAFTQVLADPTLPTVLKVISAAGILASGIAQQAQIIGTPIPSAQTGGSFEIPETTSSRADNVGVMASPGERVDITPRGEEGGRSLQVEVVLSDEVLFSAVTRGIESGRVRITQDNIQGGIAI